MHRVGVSFLMGRHRRLVTPAQRWFRRGVATSWGLRELDTEMAPGDGVALIGPSGSGKTTLLRVLAGIFPPDEGDLRVRGRVGSLLSTDAGLLGVLTGRENAVLLGVLVGLSRSESIRGLDRVRSRSGLGDAFERPVSTYSQGMRARLGYAVAEQSAPDVLLLDEVHEALDHEFREVIEASALRLRAAGGIVVAAGHDHPMLARLCPRALLMESGRIEADGPFESVRREYVEAPE
jgi:homopolymeric O-antigen transport system ATP-binding protein